MSGPAPSFSDRVLALGGVIGPTVFAAGWWTLGARRRDYSPVDDAISRLAEIGAPTRPAMTAAFVGFGVGVAIYAQALRANLPGRAWITATGTGVATLGAAAFPLGGPAGDAVHGVMAAVAYATLVATPVLAAGPLARSGRRRFAASSGVAAVVSGACLVATALGTRAGLFQRAGLTIGDAWVFASALWLSSGSPHRRAAPLNRHPATGAAPRGNGARRRC